MTHTHRPVPMNHQLRDVSPTVLGLNHVNLTGDLQCGAVRDTPTGPLFQGTLAVRADPERQTQATVVPVYATGQIAHRMHEAGLNGQKIDLNGIVHQHHRPADTGPARTRVKVLTVTDADAGKASVNQATLGGVLSGQSALTTGPGGRPYISFELAINGDYRMDNGEWLIRDDHARLCAHGDQALIIDRTAPGSVITVDASLTGVHTFLNGTSFWTLHFTARRSTHGLKALRSN